MAGKETPIQSGNKARKRSSGPEGPEDISSPKVPNRKVAVNIGSAKRCNIATGDKSHNAINVSSQKEVKDAGTPVARPKSNPPKEESPKDMSDPEVPNQNVTVNMTDVEESNIATGDDSHNVINVDSQKEGDKRQSLVVKEEHDPEICLLQRAISETGSAEVQDAGTPVARVESNSPKEGKLHWTVLNRCLIALVRNLDYDLVSMYIQENEVLDELVLQDIRDLGKTSEKIKELIRKVQQGDVDTYRKFKECLVQAKQEFLKDMLEEQEEKAQRCTVSKDKSYTKREEKKSDEGADKKKGHVMISYCWAQKEKAVWVKERLKTYGYSIWIDDENMERKLLDSMAKAVEGAYVVLLCMSEDYKSSRNCEIEAKYARDKKKVIIPLKMEDLELDGWLGILVTDNIFYNFSRNPPSEEEMKKLLQELANYYNKDFKESEIVQRDSTIVSQEETGPAQDFGDNQSTGSE